MSRAPTAGGLWAAVVAALLLAGCGIKGPLRPPPAPLAVQSSTVSG